MCSRFRSACFLSLALLSFSNLVCTAAEGKAPPPPSNAVTATPAAIAGRYVGKWQSGPDSGGALRITLKPAEAGGWAAEASFTFEGTTIPTTMKSAKVDGAKLQLVFDWVLDGTKGQSTLTGELSGDKLGGTYQTITDNPSSGTWSVTRQAG